MQVLIEWTELIIFHILLDPNACLWNTYQRDECQEHRRMSPSADLTLEQLQEIIEDEMKTDQGASEVL